jgi:hypothetical protein
MPALPSSICDMLSYLFRFLLKGFKEADYIGALIYAVIVNQVSCSVWAVDFVAF